MPNIKSAIKRVKTSEIRRQRNASNRSALNTMRRTYLDAIASGDEPRIRTMIEEANHIRKILG